MALDDRNALQKKMIGKGLSFEMIPPISQYG